MKIIYIEDENGKFISEDGKYRFSKLTGKELYAYLTSAKGKEKFFDFYPDDHGDEIGLEVPPSKIKQYLKDKRHKQYLDDIKEKSGIVEMSYDTIINTDGEELSGEEIISDPDADVEAEMLHRIELQTLRKALKILSAEESAMIHALYLSDNPITEAEFGASIGESQQTVHYRKNAILKKIKKFFEKSFC
jgi:DNA-directed RNA polymerase specialized sigma subunit